MNTHPTELLTTAEKRAWLASIFRDQSGDFTDADKLKALEADTRLALIEETRPAGPENGIKNTEPAPKYDPSRKFRKGDIVRHVPHNGRECPAMPLDEYYRVKTLTVVEDEDANHNVFVETQDGRNKYIRFCFLELVTPVEEIEPYSVSEATVQYLVKKDNKKVVAQFCKLYHPNAKAAAEAERDRLNAKHRKEQNNV